MRSPGERYRGTAPFTLVLILAKVADMKQRCRGYAEPGELAVNPAVAPGREMLSSAFPGLCGAGDCVNARDGLLVMVFVSRGQRTERLAGHERSEAAGRQEAAEATQQVIAGAAGVRDPVAQSASHALARFSSIVPAGRPCWAV